MSYSWHDDRINFTGVGNLSAPSYTWINNCEFFWFVCHLEKSPPIIWMPHFGYATPNSVEKSIPEEFMTIQKV